MSAKKRILFLGYADSPLISFLRESGDEVVVTEERLSLEWLKTEAFDFLVSYGYRFILKAEVLSLFGELAPGGASRAINLHISLLPWNRGADPNFWSIVDSTPQGVTIHHLDTGVDTGDIIAQTQVTLLPTETLESSYQRLHQEIQALFQSKWPSIRELRSGRVRQAGAGSVHRKAEKSALEHLMVRGWQTTVAELRAAVAMAGQEIGGT